MKQQERFELVYDIGETLLKNGAEVKRVESTITHVAQAFELENFDSYVSIHGIFLTATPYNKNVQAKVRDTPLSPTSLGRIDAINTLFRHITEGKIDPYEARKQLTIIQHQTFSSLPLKFIAYMFGSASFCYIFSGTFIDSLGAFFLGMILACYSLFIVPKLKLSQIIVYVTSSFIVSLCAAFMTVIFPSLNLMSVITGGIVSLLPGVNGYCQWYSGSF